MIFKWENHIMHFIIDNKIGLISIPKQRLSRQKLENGVSNKKINVCFLYNLLSYILNYIVSSRVLSHKFVIKNK